MTENVEVPEYFICPISLQIMNDPVTVTSGITYDRRSIEQWLLTNHNTICPVTKHPLPHPAPLTPNHTLRRLIHAWLTLHTPSPASKAHIANLMGGLGLGPPDSQLCTLRKLESLALQSERHRAYMAEADLPKKLMHFVAACRRQGSTEGLAEALSMLYHIRGGSSTPTRISKMEGRESIEIIDSLMWVFESDRYRDDETVKSHAAHALRAAVAVAGAGVLERLRPEFFKTAARGLRSGGGAGVGQLVQVLMEACPWGRNRAMMVEAGVVFELVEVELRCGGAAEEKGRKRRTTEAVMGIIYQLCGSAEGRAQLLGHAAGIAVVTGRMLEVSAAVLIIWQIAKYSATKGVVQEMMRVGTVTNLCLVMLADTAAYLKDKARMILRMHFDAWKDSPCIEIATLTRYTR